MGSADMKVNDSVSLLLEPVPLILFSLGHTSLLALNDSFIITHRGLLYFLLLKNHTF